MSAHRPGDPGQLARDSRDDNVEHLLLRSWFVQLQKTPSRPGVHSWPLDRFTAGLGIRRVVFVRLDIGTYVPGRHQLHLMAICLKPTGPMMRTRPSLHANPAARDASHQPLEANSGGFASTNRVPFDTNTMSVKH